jgi:flagellar basal-body rod protein FlgB
MPGRRRPPRFEVDLIGATQVAGIRRALARSLPLGRRMIDPLFQSDTMQLARKLLDAAALRQDAIAANLANSETPGYRRVDLSPDFATQLKASWQAGELAGGNVPSLKPTLAEDRVSRAIRSDGNNVEIEHELLAMNKNSVEYEYLTDVVTHDIKQLKLAISGQVS